MKKRFVALLFFLGYIAFAAQTYAQELSTFAAKDLKKLYVSGYFKVELIKGNEEKVAFVASPVVKRLVRVQVSKGKVSIKGESKRLERVITERLTIQIYYKTLETIKAHNGAYVLGKDLIRYERLHLVATSGSRVNLKVQTQDLSAKVRTQAEVMLAGFTDVFQAKVKKGASLKALNLKTNICYVSAREQSSASVFVRETVYLSTGVGSLIQYQGNPKKVLKWRGISLNIEF